MYLHQQSCQNLTTLIFFLKTYQLSSFIRDEVKISRLNKMKETYSFV